MEFDRWAVPNVVDLIGKAKQAVLTANPKLTEDDIAIRFMWSEDWDFFNATAVPANRYFQTFAGLTDNMFKINKVDKHFAVIIIGVFLGNLGGLLSAGSIQIIIGQKTVREYPGILVTSQLNGICLFTDGIFTLEKKKVEVHFFTSAVGPAVCTAYPYGVVIIPAGA